MTLEERKEYIIQLRKAYFALIRAVIYGGKEVNRRVKQLKNEMAQLFFEENCRYRQEVCNNEEE